MSKKINDELKDAINEYISLYNEMKSQLNKKVVAVPNSSYTSNGKEYTFYSKSEEECKKIINDSIKTNTLKTYEYAGAYNDDPTQQTRAIPTFIGNVKSIEQAKAVAGDNGATVFGIQFGGQLFISTKDVASALSDAKQFGLYKSNCDSDLGCSLMNQVYVLKSGSFSGGTYYKMDEYNYVGSFNDKSARAIPNYIGNATSTQNAEEMASNNGATVYGIQSGGQIFINTNNKTESLNLAEQYGKADCNSALGCALVNQVYQFSGNNCFLYDEKIQGTWVEGGTGTAFVGVEEYYGDKMSVLFDRIQRLMGESDAQLQVEYDGLMGELQGTSYPGFIETVTAQKEALEKFATDSKLITVEYATSFDDLRNKNISLRIWVFLFLFVLFIIFQLFQSPLLKSISYVCLFFMLAIIITIVKLLSPFLFMILILFSLFSVVLALFYQKKYFISFGILIVGSIIFALIYRL